MYFLFLVGWPDLQKPVAAVISKEVVTLPAFYFGLLQRNTSRQKQAKERWKEFLHFLPIVPSDLSLLAFGMPPAREAGSAGGMPKVPKGQGLGRLAR